MYEPETVTRFKRQAHAIINDPMLDPESLGQLREIQTAWETATAAAVVRLIARGYSWADVGRGLGMTRQQAHRTFSPYVALDQAKHRDSLVSAVTVDLGQ